MRSLKYVFAALVALAVAHAGAASAEPVKIKFGWVVVPATMMPLFEKKKDILKNYGKSYVLDSIHFKGTPLMITALATGDADITTLAYSSLALAIQNAKIKDIRVIADSFQDGVKGGYTNPYMVREDSPIKTVKDLKGKVVASNVAGSAVDIALRAMLRKNGLDDRKDVTFVEVPLPNMQAVLAEKKVDLVPAVLPFSASPKFQEVGRPLFTQKDAIGKSQMIILVARAGFLEKNRAAMIDFLEDALIALHWYTDPANHDEVVDMVADFTKRSPKLFDSWLFVKGKDYFRDPMMIPDLEALQSNIDLQYKLGFLKEEIPIAEYSDLSLIKEAGKRFK